MNAIKKGKESADEIKADKQIGIGDIYTPLSVAKKEIKKRWEDKELRKKVEAFLGGEIPAPFKKEPRAVLSRNIMTPNIELTHFIDLAKIAKLKPIGLEGTEDKFYTNNFDKVSLAKLSFFENIKNDKNKFKPEKKIVKLMDIEKCNGKSFCKLDTFWGENLVDFHHRLLDIYNYKIEIFDDFNWFSKRNMRNDVHQYYEKFLLFFICHGILFENFHLKGKEKNFTENVVITSYKKILNEFNLKPLIVPIIPVDDELFVNYWDGYLIK